MDLTQLLANAFAGAFGMGLANELYHAFVEYRKLLKQRLLNDALSAIATYRRLKAEERFRDINRRAAIPHAIRPTAIYEETTIRPMPVLDFARRPEPLLFDDSPRPIKREAAIESNQSTTNLTYLFPSERPRSRVDTFDNMVDWEKHN